MKPLDPLTLDLTGLNLIEASAGTGKTYTLTSLVLRLVAEEGLRIDEILTVTFTEAATVELGMRIRARLREGLDALERGRAEDPLYRKWLDAGPERRRIMARLDGALRDIDRGAVFTIHGFCRRVLEDYALETRIPQGQEILTDPTPLVDEVVRDFWALELFRGHPVLLDALGDPAALLEDLVRLGRTAAERPDLALEPLNRDAADPEPPPVGSWDEASALFRDEKTVIEGQLLAKDVLNKNSYSKEKVEKLLERAEAFLTGNRPLIYRLPKPLESLKESFLKKRTRKGKVPPDHEFFRRFEALAGELDAVREWVDLRLDDLRRRLVAYVREEATARRDRARQLSFPDLIHRLREALASPSADALRSGVKEAFKAALIDEFQDTDPIQFAIFRELFGDGSVPFLLIGDPKQSIYAFRGADLLAYLEAVEARRDRTFTLDRNWRSDGTLVKALNALFGRCDDPFLDDRIPFRPVGVPPHHEQREIRIRGRTVPALGFRFLEARPETSGTEKKKGPPRFGKTEGVEVAARTAAHDLARLLRDGVEAAGPDGARRLGPSDAAVLVRNHKQAQAMETALHAAGLPCVLFSDRSVYDSPEAEDLRGFLEGVAEPGRRDRVLRALVTDLVGLTGNRIAELEEEDAAWGAWILRFREWHALWSEQGFMALMTSLTTLTAPDSPHPLAARWLAREGGERRMTNLRHLVDLMHRAEGEERLGPTGLLRWLVRRIEAEARPTDDTQLRLESDAEAVRIVTQHKSKGLEYPLVYCPFLWHADFHGLDGSSAPRGSFVVHDEEPPHQNRLYFTEAGKARRKDDALREARAEDLRLLYVALTRARHLCLVLWGGFREMEKSALARLLHAADPEVRSLDFEEHVAGLEDASLTAALDRLAEASDGAAGWSVSDPDATDRYDAKVSSPPVLSRREAKRDVLAVRSRSSFTGLVRAGSRGAHEDEPDHDETPEEDFPVITPGGADASAFEKEGASPQGTLDFGGDRITVPLNDFPRGAIAGTGLHHLLEHLDFTASPDDRVEPIRRALTRFKFRPEDRPDRWLGPVNASLTALLETPLPGGASGIRLSTIRAEDRLDEWEFLLPAALDRRRDRGIAPREIAAAMGKNEALSARYLADLTSLGFEGLRGFLKGFVDLVFVHDGRWYLADYKSNRLGPVFGDYAEHRLIEAMESHHYYLQYHLYTVALNRFLALRLGETYHYETHFGGVFYLFLRGIRGGAPGESRGIFFDRPSHRVVKGLDRLFGGRP